MLSLPLHTFIGLSTVLVTAAGVTMDTVVGVAGRRVTLPCRVESAGQAGVEVCWGRGQPSLFTCHNTVLNTAGDQTTYRKSSRYSSSSSSSSSSLSISNSRPSDSGFYHCRVQLPGLFNDQTTAVYLIIIRSRSEVIEPSDREHAGKLNTPTTTGFSTAAATAQTGSDVTGHLSTELMVPVVQPSVQVSGAGSLPSFIMNTLRASAVVFVPTLLLTAAHRLWRANQRAGTDGGINQSEEEEESPV